jgi:endonuclease YncB( thermonuclease family)
MMDDRCKWFEFKLTKIVDGDSLTGDIGQGFSDVKMNQNIRLWSIDTNEVRRGRGRDAEDVQHGKMARDYLRELLEVGEMFVIQTHEKESGKFGRWLVTLWKGTLNVNRSLVRKYLAVAYHGQNKKEVRGEHRKNICKLKGLGRWTG